MCTSHLTQKLSSRLSSKITCYSAPLLKQSSQVGRWYQWCPTCSMPIPWPQKHPNSWTWPHPLRWSSHHSSIRKGEDPPSNTWRTHGNQQMSKQSQTLSVLAWNQLWHHTSHWIMPNMPTSLPKGITTAAPANTCPGMPMATPWHWLLPFWWIWIPSCHGLLLQDAHQQGPSQCNASKTISVLKELFAKHGIPKVLTMAPHLPMHSSLSLQQTESFTITSVHLGIIEAMVKLKQPSRPSKGCSPMPSALVKTHT